MTYRTYLFFIAILFQCPGISAQIDSLSHDQDTVITRDYSKYPLPGKNMYGDLLNDDPYYNPKYPAWIPAVRIVAANAFNWAVARYAYDFDWARISLESGKNNIKNGFEWDVDNFGINFIGHPHTGNYYFNIARSNGYSFWQSLPFAIEGSVIWEYFGENQPPSLNDVINTPLSGMFLGEIVYRVSSNILDDTKRGHQRVWREILAGVINPPRALNRLTQGKLWRVTPGEVYQKEPLNFTFRAGARRINLPDDFGSGPTNAIFTMQLDYGNPFEIRRRKPFDVFRFRTELSYGTTHTLENINGYGILTGRNSRNGKLLAGIFQHFDYWNNNVFEVGTLGFGGGIISRLPISQKSDLYSIVHLAAVPLAGNNTRYGPDDSEYRTYNFGGGFQVKLEETLNIGERVSAGFTGFYYWIHTYSGIPGNNWVGVLRPMVTVRVFKNISIGFEQHIYQNDRSLNNNKNLHLTRTEQKLFLQWYVEDKQRSGKYH